MPHARMDDGTLIHYRLAGRPSRRGLANVILIHGWCSNLEHWAPVSRALQRDHRVLRLDLRGHGRSEAPERGYSIRGFTDDVAALARALRIRNAAVIGHSMGGSVAIELARRQPQVVRALILVEAPIRRAATAGELEESPLWRLVAGAEGTDGVRRFYQAFFPEDAPRDTRVLGQGVVEDAARMPRHAALAALRATLTHGNAAAARRLRQPTLYVNGSRNDRTASDVQAMLPRAEFAQVVRAGHFLQLEVPDQLVPMLRRYLGTL